MALFQINEIEADVIRIERFIKKQKSRRLLEKLIRDDFKPDGALVYKQSLHLNNNKYEVTLSNMPKGLYIIKINNATNSIQRKLLLE
jgi:hypothetical protein